MGKTGGTDFKSVLPLLPLSILTGLRLPFAFSVSARGLPRGLPPSRPFFPRSVVDGPSGWRDGKNVLIAPLETPGRAPANVGRGGGLPGARIAAFSGYPAVAAKRPQSHLSEHCPVRVMTLQRSETMQGRKNASERIGTLPHFLIREQCTLPVRNEIIGGSVISGQRSRGRDRGFPEEQSENVSGPQALRFQKA